MVARAMKRYLALVVAFWLCSTMGLVMAAEEWSVDLDWAADLGVSSSAGDDLLVGSGFETADPSWLADKIRALNEFATFDAPANQPPYIMLAGYYDTDVTYAEGGTFKMIAYVMDPDGPQDVANVELYYEGMPTGVYLLDDGASGDFGAGDQVYGLMFYLEPGQLPAGTYTLELVATDHAGNMSDMWPYLTVHP